MALEISFGLRRGSVMACLKEAMTGVVASLAWVARPSSAKSCRASVCCSRQWRSMYTAVRPILAEILRACVLPLRILILLLLVASRFVYSFFYSDVDIIAPAGSFKSGQWIGPGCNER